MRAELMLRLASDPNAIRNLESIELCELLADPEPPAWVIEEAARRVSDDMVMAHLFSHPAADVNLLEKAIRQDTRLLERFQHRVDVFGGRLELSNIFANLLPDPSTLLTESQLTQLLVEHLSPLCLKYCEVREGKFGARQARRSLTGEDKADKRLEASFRNLGIPRRCSPLTRVMLLGDFLYYHLAEDTFEPRDLPVLAQVALALNSKQRLEPFLEHTDVRIRLAAKERQSWNTN